MELTIDELKELVGITRELANACRNVASRLVSNELVNRPSEPGNEYDQPAYDAAKAAYEKWEAFNAAMVRKTVDAKNNTEIENIASKLCLRKTQTH